MKNQLPIVEVRVRGPVEVRVIHEYPTDPETRKKWEEYLRPDKRKRRRKEGDE